MFACACRSIICIYYNVYAKMRTAIIEKPNFFNIWNTMHDNIMKMMSTHMFLWSRHDEADVTMIAYLLQAAESGQSIIRILTDDTDVFVLLVYWVWKMQLHSAVHMERWNGVVIDINATCLLLGSKCLQLPGMHQSAAATLYHTQSTRVRSVL